MVPDKIFMRLLYSKEKYLRKDPEKTNKHA
jgi:hypothetical protein